MAAIPELATDLLRPKLSDEEVKQSSVIRDRFRSALIKGQSFWSDRKPIFQDTPFQTKYSEILSLIENNLSWVNANIEVPLRKIEIKEKDFNETSKTMYDAFVKNVKEEILTLPPEKQTSVASFFEGPVGNEIRAVIQAKQREEKAKEQEKVTAKLKRGFWEILRDAWEKVKPPLFSSVTVIIIVVLALRAASFAVNDNLWRPLPYRILLFIYTFLYFPITVPYYLYRVIRSYFSVDPDMKPHMEGMFPVNTYVPEPNVDVSLWNRLFGYELNDNIQSWLQKKREAYDQERLKVLESNVLNTLKEEQSK